MASSEEKEIVKHLKLALREIGAIEPWYSKQYKSWIFSHELYPVEYSGDTKEEVIQNYPLYLKEFIKHRLLNKLASIMEKKTKGHGGMRKGSGRPKGTIKEPQVRISLPKEIVDWLRIPGTVNHLQEVLHAYKRL